MALESLLQLLETLSQRIDAHGAALKRSETLTRYALIDPLLRGLGWDTADPAMVMPEYVSPSGSADYALFDGDNATPLMVVAAKPLGETLQNATMPGIVHCFTEGIRYFAVTNGQAWDVYETHKPVPMEQKRVASFDLQSMMAAEARLQALAIWRPNMLDGKVTPAQSPDMQRAIGTPAQSPATQRSIEKPAEAKPTQTPTYTSAEEKLRRAIFGDKHDGSTHASSRQACNRPSRAYSSGAAEWIAISDIRLTNQRAASSPSNKRSAKPAPIEILFPDETTVANPPGYGGWQSVLVKIVHWLLSEDCLNASNWTIVRGKRYILHSDPVHPSGREFEQPIQVGKLWYQAKYDRIEHTRNARIIINRAGQDPSQFKVRF